MKKVVSILISATFLLGACGSQVIVSPTPNNVNDGITKIVLPTEALLSPFDSIIKACDMEVSKGNAKYVNVFIPPGKSLDWITNRGDVSDCYTQSGPGGSSLFTSLEEAVFAQLAGQNMGVIARDSDGQPTGIQSGYAMMYMKPDIPIIYDPVSDETAYMPALTAGDVGLPWDTSTTNPTLRQCYLLTLTSPFNFHAGDGISYNPLADKVHYVLNPISGNILVATDLRDVGPDGIGWAITIATDFSKDGKQVFVDFVHTSGLVPSLSEGQHIERGQPLLVLDRHWGGGGLDLFLDIGIRNGPVGANPLDENFSPLSYFGFFKYIEDDLSSSS